ncbi:tetratricopeptide repeat protein [Rhizobium sp. ARZ01]|uniref:adenylate/guanylate cyclase domain-containing protein n=1 Tax=Rhizobium sp. ARZ01 TaxID=2769313 RepID=UPI001781F5C9|nr:adenylate/guanylate cyclase domain-containing protein [Rhizobium sp. ARZ01]MBD9375108.1 tetratricopeptide repeat protein [Rhizobium sp. ARZ01]
MERHLAAVMIADVAGYSRLSQRDEEGTRACFQRDLAEVFQPRFEEHHGRLVKTMGDGILGEFRSVVDALRCALAIQQAKRERDRDVPRDLRLDFRIGINLGDVIVEGDDIHGGGVNIADRLQSLAEPGGIAISASTYEQVKGKVAVGFVDLGLQWVRNVDEPVRVYLVAGSASSRAPPAVRRRRRRRLLVACAVALLALVAGGLAWWQPWTPLLSPAPIAYPIPDKPSVAVLPFINVTGDKAQDHLAQGLTDDLITELSKVSGLFVIARHSVISLGETAGNFQDVANELGVHYVLEGTLQRAGLQLRINVKLIDAMSGLSLWAERYDRQFTDLFAVQDDVIGKIASALEISLSEGERERLARIPTENLEAYDNYMRAERIGVAFNDVESYREALSFYQKAIDLDPQFADAHAGIARAAVDIWRNDYNYIWSAAVARKIAYDAAGEALKLDPGNARAQSVLALLQLVDGHPREALESAERAVDAQPNDPEAYANLALVLAHAGDREKAIANIDRALRLDPSPPENFRLLAGVVLYAARDNGKAIPLLKAARDALPNSEHAREFLAAAYVSEGNKSAAAEQVEALRSLFPEANLAYYGYLYDYWRPDGVAYHLENLKAAGVPQWPFGFEGKPEDKLDPTQLHELVDDKTWQGRHRNGTEFFQFFDAAGNTAYRSANTSITGTVKLEDGRLCEQFPGYFLDRMVCGDIFRNTDKEKHPGTDYVHVTPQVLKYFSLVP